MSSDRSLEREISLVAKPKSPGPAPFHREFIDKILKGRTPADLPVEQSKRFEFLVKLNAAKQIGLTIPPNVLARADKVIR